MTIDQTHATDGSREHRIWARVGMTLYVSDETYEKLVKGDNNALKSVLLGQDGRAVLDGETYFPESLDNKNENNLLKYEFDLSPTPLHDATEKSSQRDTHSISSDLKSFYYTFGTTVTQPFQKGWVEVQAQNRQNADELFRSTYPDRTPGVLNCSSVYDQAQFSKYLDTLSEHPDWNVCHDTLREPSEGKVYVLCEEHEDDNGIRDFEILGVSTDQDALQKLLSAKVKKDEYGLIASNGLVYDDPYFIQTDYVEERGIVKYYLQEEDLLNKEQIQSLLQTPAYDTTFQHPDNLPALLNEAISELAEGRGYGVLETEKAVDTFMNDPKFQAFVKQTWWGDIETIKHEAVRIAKSHIRQFVADYLDEDPSFFVQIGAISKDRIPENLKDILISSIYDVYRDYRLPVTNVDAQVEQLFTDPGFVTDVIDPYRGYCHLKEGTEVYQDALQSCHAFVKSNLVQTKNQRHRFDDLLTEAHKKLDNQQTSGSKNSVLPDKSI